MSKLTIEDINGFPYFDVQCPTHNKSIPKGRKVSVGCDTCVKERRERNHAALNADIAKRNDCKACGGYGLVRDGNVSRRCQNCK